MSRGFIGAAWWCAISLASADAWAADTMVVHVKGGSGAVLEREADHGAGTWTAMCTSPCSVVAERGKIYRLGGGGVRQSDSIRLPSEGDETTLYVTKATSGEHAGAWFMSILGGALLLGGGGTILGALVAFPPETCLTACSNAAAGSQTLVTAGVIGLVLGGIVMVFGIISLKPTAKTTVVQMPQVRWDLEVGPGRQPVGPTATMMPLVRVTF